MSESAQVLASESATRPQEVASPTIDPIEDPIQQLDLPQDALTSSDATPPNDAPKPDGAQLSGYFEGLSLAMMSESKDGTISGHALQAGPMGASVTKGNNRLAASTGLTSALFSMSGGRADNENGVASVGVDQMNIGGIRTEDVAAQASGDWGSVGASVGKVDTSTSVKNANFSIGNGEMSAGVEEYSGGGFTVEDAAAAIDTKYGSLNASVGKVDTNTSVKNANFSIGNGALNAGVEEYSGGGITVEDAAVGAQFGNTSVNASAGKIDTNTSVKDAKLSLSSAGLDASVASVSTGVSVEDAKLNASGDWGSVDAGVGKLKTGVDVEGASLAVNKAGLKARVDKVSGGGADISDAHVNVDTDLLSVDASMGSGQFYRGSAEDVFLNLDKNGLSAGASNVEAGAVRMTDVDASVGLFDDAVKANASADEINVFSGSIGTVEAQTDLITGKLQVSDAEASLFEVKNAKAGLDIGGTTVVGVAGNADVSGSLKDAQVSWDLSKLQASASVEDLNVGGGWSDASVTIAGTTFEVPDFEVRANINAGGEIDLFQGAVAAEVSLEGSKLNLFGLDMEVGSWAQLGADINIAEGEFNLNLFGYEADIDGMVSDAWDGLVQLGGDAGSWLASTGADLWQGAKSMGSDLIDNISGGISAAGDWISSVGDSLWNDTAGLIDGALSGFSAAGDALMSAASNAGAYLWSNAQHIVSGFLQFLQDLFDAVSDFFTGNDSEAEKRREARRSYSRKKSAAESQQASGSASGKASLSKGKALLSETAAGASEKSSALQERAQDRGAALQKTAAAPREKAQTARSGEVLLGQATEKAVEISTKAEAEGAGMVLRAENDGTNMRESTRAHVDTMTAGAVMAQSSFKSKAQTAGTAITGYARKSADTIIAIEEDRGWLSSRSKARTKMQAAAIESGEKIQGEVTPMVEALRSVAAGWGGTEGVVDQVQDDAVSIRDTIAAFASSQKGKPELFAQELSTYLESLGQDQASQVISSADTVGSSAVAATQTWGSAQMVRVSQSTQKTAQKAASGQQRLSSEASTQEASITNDATGWRDKAKGSFDKSRRSALKQARASTTSITNSAQQWGSKAVQESQSAVARGQKLSQQAQSSADARFRSKRQSSDKHVDKNL